MPDREFINYRIMACGHMKVLCCRVPWFHAHILSFVWMRHAE